MTKDPVCKFVCDDCEHRWESNTLKGRWKCPKCGSRSVFLVAWEAQP